MTRRWSRSRRESDPATMLAVVMIYSGVVLGVVTVALWLALR